MADFSGTKKKASGCWTCRVRRKKCDETQPVCLACTSLGISCDYSTVKPPWMDGGSQQKAMAESLKNQIKSTAHGRRERQAVGMIIDNSQQTATTAGGDTSFVITSEQDFQNGSSSAKNILENNTDMENFENGVMRLEIDPSGPSSVNGIEQTSSDDLSSVSASRLQTSDTSLKLSPNKYFDEGLEEESLLTAYYIDYVFPFLFPFYRPDPFTGRSWLFFGLKKCKVAFHSALGLSAYLLSMKLYADLPEQQSTCKTEAWGKVIDQSNISFKAMQQDITALGLHSGAILKHKSRLMQGIIQMLIFEVSVGRSANWESHMTAAAGLFRDICQSTPLEQVSQLDFESVLYEIDTNLSITYSIAGGAKLWSHDQNGFRFYTAVLVFIDIIASASLNTKPRLMQYYPQILSDESAYSKESSEISIKLSEVVGCQTWALIAIAKVREMEAWRKEQARLGTLSMAELVKVTSAIHAEITANIIVLDKDDGSESRNSTQPGLSTSFPLTHSPPSSTITKIWAYAAQLYLAVIVIGWERSNFEVSWSVRYVLQFVKKLMFPAHLRAVAWPLCIAGCLAENDSVRKEFLEIFNVFGPLDLLGALGQAKIIMEKVWLESEGKSGRDWDIAACFNVWGDPIILI